MENRKLSIVAIVISITTLVFTASWNIYTFQIEQLQQNFEPKILLSYIGKIRLAANFFDTVPLSTSLSLTFHIISPHECTLEVRSVLFIPNSNVSESGRIEFENVTIKLTESIIAIGAKGTSTIPLTIPVVVATIGHLSLPMTDALLGKLDVSIFYEDAVTKKTIETLFTTEVIQESDYIYMEIP